MYVLPLFPSGVCVCVCVKVKKEALSEMKEHKKLIEKGKPDDVPAGFRFRTVSLHNYITNSKSMNPN